MDDKKYKVPQIYYSNWSRPLEEGHEDYWWKINKIAEWISFALVGGHRDGGSSSWQSTIGIAQAKEKFGEVRVYCYMAMYEAVEQKYKKHTKKIRKKNNKYREWIVSGNAPLHKVGEYKSGKYPLEVPTVEDFTEQCYFNDMKHYRDVYFDAFRLWPQYEKAIRRGADYMEYLFETDGEIDEYFDSIMKKQLGWYSKSASWTEEGEANIVKNIKGKRDKIKNTCNFLNNMGENDA